MSDTKIDTKKIQLSIPADVHTSLTEYATLKGVSLGDAIAGLVRTAVGRRAAVNNYAAKKAHEARIAKIKAEKAAKAGTKIRKAA